MLLPEIAIVTTVAILALLEIFYPDFSRRHTTFLNLAGALLVGGMLVLLLKTSGTAFQGMFVLDPFAVFFKFLFLASAVYVFLLTRPSPLGKRTAEFNLLLWSALLGMFFLVSSNHFLLFFISLELLTLSLYILAAYTERDRLSIEAGLKYLVLGSLASAFFLYGMSLIYAASGTLSFKTIGLLLQTDEKIPWLFLVGTLLVLSALGFKVAAVPFHVWVPDVYQGAPTPVVAFLSVASKSAGFAALLRLLFETFAPLDEERRILFSLFAAMTLLYGNLGALVQKNMKRLLGFSSIGHAGFLLIALAAREAVGGEALLYYLMAYGVTNLAAFLVVFLVEIETAPRAGVSPTSIESFQGLSGRSPFLAAGMFLAFLSLAGVPPLAGFFAKFLILLAAAKSELFWIVFLGAVNVAISLYYYLNVIRILYFEKPKLATPISLSLPSVLLLGTLMVGIVGIGIWQAPFLRIASLAAASLRS